MATASNLRIGHSEREATVAGLREHYAQGRLTLEEFNQRLDATFSAKTAADLERVTADLPRAGDGTEYQGRRALTGARWPAADAGSWQGGSWQGGSWQGGPWQGGSSQGGGSRAGTSRRTCFSVLSAIAAVLMVALAVVVVVSFFIPFALFGLWTARPLLILAAILMFARRIIRRIFGGRPVRTRRRGRWPI